VASKHTFSDYTVPALILAIVVGGSSLLGAGTIFTGRAIGVLASLAAGLIVAGYIVVEVVTLRQGASRIEGLYFGLGLLISGLAAYLWRAEHRGHRLQIRHI
jgi:drug/metabolite transporter (DMT)-like permease